MKAITILIAATLLFAGQAISQTETPVTTEVTPPKPIIKKLQQTEENRVVDPQNEKFLYEATAKLIKNADYADFSIVTSWYKQTRTHYYYLIGWEINGSLATDYMKYNWADGSVSLVSKEDMEADTDYSKPDGSN